MEQQPDSSVSIELSVDPTTATEPAGLSPPGPHITAARQKTMFKVGILIVLVSIYGASNPPIQANTPMSNNAHAVLSHTYSVAAYATLAVGALQLLLATLVRWVPQLVYAGNTATAVGLVLVRVMLGYGTSLVLLAEASPWFALYVVFLSIPFST